MTLILKTLMRLDVSLKEPIFIGETPRGFSAVVTIEGGRFYGPRLSGAVIATGSDWNAYRPREEVMDFWARYELHADDGTYISLINQGVGHVSRDCPEKLASGAPLGSGIWDVKTKTTFEAPIDSAHAWLNRGVYVGAMPFPADPKTAIIDIFEVSYLEAPRPLT